MSHFNVGDKGQRYEVHFLLRSGEEKRMGWTNEPDGGQLFKSACLWPGVEYPFIVDRQTRHEWILPPLSNMRSNVSISFEANPGDVIKYPFCRVCGIVRNHVESNVNPCKGPTKMRKMERL